VRVSELREVAPDRPDPRACKGRAIDVNTQTVGIPILSTCSLSCTALGPGGSVNENGDESGLRVGSSLNPPTTLCSLARASVALRAGRPPFSSPLSSTEMAGQRDNRYRRPGLLGLTRGASGLHVAHPDAGRDEALAVTPQSAKSPVGLFSRFDIRCGINPPYPKHGSAVHLRNSCMVNLLRKTDAR
jgi:hypothetical protein